MKILYQAEDGTIFDDEDKCYAYETVNKFPELFLIDFYDINNNLYHINKADPFNDDIYNRCEKIHIHNDVELSILHWISTECGWCEFEDQITEPGIWVREAKNNIISNAEWRKVCSD